MHYQCNCTIIYGYLEISDYSFIYGITFLYFYVCDTDNYFYDWQSVRNPIVQCTRGYLYRLARHEGGSVAYVERTVVSWYNTASSITKHQCYTYIPGLYIKKSAKFRCPSHWCVSPKVYIVLLHLMHSRSRVCTSFPIHPLRFDCGRARITCAITCSVNNKRGMRELLRLSGAYRCPLRRQRWTSLHSFVVRILYIRIPSLPTNDTRCCAAAMNEPLKFSVSVGIIFCAVRHLHVDR